MALQIIILAAGQGKRMQSQLPKVLQSLAGQPLLKYVIDTAKIFSPKQIHVIYGHQGEQVKQAFSEEKNLNWIYQKEQLGTAHAVNLATEFLDDQDQVLILYGDVPLIQAKTLQSLLAIQQSAVLCLLTAYVADPTGYGRIIREQNQQVAKIVEHRDANPSELAIKEIYTGIMAIAANYLKQALSRIQSKNDQQEYYLTDVVTFAMQDHLNIQSLVCDDEWEIQGVNDRLQLIQLERYYQRHTAENLLRSGVHIFDPNRFDCRGQLTTGKDITIDVNTVFEGQNHLADGVRIEANCYLKNVTIQSNTVIRANSVLEDCVIGANCTVGPFARIRPETKLADHVRVGNFVEIKKSEVGEHSKIPHLSYIGDAMIGKHVNVGAGTITCNYDGVKKYQTIIEDHVFIGSDTQLIAPVMIGRGAHIAAGSTVKHEVPAKQLTVTHRLEQRVIEHWKKPEKEEKN